MAALEIDDKQKVYPNVRFHNTLLCLLIKSIVATNVAMHYNMGSGI